MQSEFPDQLQTQLTVNDIYSPRVTKHIKLQEDLTSNRHRSVVLLQKMSRKLLFILSVSEKEHLVIADFKFFSARYKDGEFT